MGSLTSTPRAAQQQQVVYVPTPVTSTPVTTTPTPSTGTDTTPDPATPGAGEERTANLLRRNRGIFGTVQTSFRGFLSQAGQGTQCKSLLGE